MNRQRTALAAFITDKMDIDNALERLQRLSESHFNVNPDELTWGDADSLAHLKTLLKHATDFAFNEGE